MIETMLRFWQGCMPKARVPREDAERPLARAEQATPLPQSAFVTIDVGNYA